MNKWNEDDIHKLFKMLNANVSITEISKTLNRSRSAVKSKIKRVINSDNVSKYNIDKHIMQRYLVENKLDKIKKFVVLMQKLDNDETTKAGLQYIMDIICSS